MSLSQVFTTPPASPGGCRPWGSGCSGFRSQLGIFHTLNSVPNRCLKLTACGTLAARQNSPALARRSLTMR